MKKLICALIGAAALVASAATYIQTSSTGTAPWRPVKDSVSQAHLADSARHAPPSAYADSSRVSGLADSAKRAGWAPLDSGRVRGIVGDTATTLRSNMAGYLPLIGGTLTGFLTGTSAELWTNINAHDYGPALTLHGSIYTSDANLLLRSSAGYGNFVGFSDQSKSTGFQRWNLGVENDAFQIHANSSDGPGGESVLKLDRNGNLTILGTLTAFSFTGNAATATKLATARTIATSGDVTGTPTAFDGTANITIPTALPTLLTAGSAGSATTVPTLTWDAKGRLTAVGSVAISIPHTQINDWSSYVSTAAIGALPCAGVSGSVDFNNIASKVAGAYPIFGTTSYSNAPPGLAVNNGGGMLWQGFGANGVDWNAQVFVDAQQDLLWYRTEGSPATWRSWRQLLTSTSSIPHTQISDWSTATSSFLTANQSISLTGAVTGSGTTSIPTSFANTHLAGINQDLTTTSSPTFGTASLGAWSYSSGYAWFGASGQNNTTNGSSGFLQSSAGDKSVYMCAPANGYANITYNSQAYLTIGAFGVSMPDASGLTVSGLITANGGISGNLTGHASLDIPLTGSSAITGALTSSNSSNIGSASFNWDTVYATSVRSTGTASISSFALSGDVLTLSHSNGDLTWVNTIRGSAAGLVLQNAIISGTFSPEVNAQSSNYTITRADQGKMVISIYTLNLPSLTSADAGFWCLVNWHVGGSGAVFGPTTSGTVWNLRGQVITVRTSMPFTGVVSWDGYTWYAG